jgi:tRNA (guanine-N7-)-methyltransferase
MGPIDYTKYKAPRLRHHVDPGLYIPFVQHKVKRIYYPPVIEAADWSRYFLNAKAPNYLDVGCGMGKFLMEYALTKPEKNILGIELRKNATEWINKVIRGEGIINAHALWYSVVNGLHFIEDKSIEKVFYLFPDPWVKKRHHKRRAFSTGLLDELHRVMKPKAKLYLMTDVDEVMESELEIIELHGKFKCEMIAADAWELEIITNQEEFCLRKNIPFHRAICVKR